MAFIRLTNKETRLAFVLSSDEISTVERLPGSSSMETVVTLRSGRTIAVEESVDNVYNRIGVAS